MILGEKNVRLSPEEVMKYISEYDIYRFYMGDFTIGTPICNTWRGENNPSFNISNTGVGLQHLDYGDGKWRGNCFNLVKQIYNCDFHQALVHIDKDFGLGISSQKTNDSPIVTWSQPKIITKKPPLIHVKTRNFSETELKWWAGYYQDLSDLKREHVYAPEEIWRNGSRIPLKSSELTFCYFYPEVGKWKIYRPEAPKLKDPKVWQYKFDSNVPFDYCDGLSDVNECDIAFLTKSRKDKMVLKKALGKFCIADVQSENPACISEETIEHYKKNSRMQVTCFDNDDTGKRTSWWLTENYGFKHCNVPDFYLKEKISDFADLARKYGIEYVQNHFRQKGFL